MSEANESGVIDKLKAWAFPVLLGALNLFLTNQIKDYASEIKETSKQITTLSTTMQVQKVVIDYLSQRVTNLETGKASDASADKERDSRLNSLEQRAAIHDQFMSTHK